MKKTLKGEFLEQLTPNNRLLLKPGPGPWKRALKKCTQKNLDIEKAGPRKNLDNKKPEP